MASTSPITILPTGPLPVLARRPPWRDTFSSLRLPNYRLYAGGQIVSTTAMGMQRVAQDWIVLQLSGSVAAVGVTVAMQFAPMLLFGLFGGVIADRYSKRMLLICTQSTAAAIAVTLSILIFTGHIQVWHIWALAFMGGLVTVVDNPARQVFVNELVGPHHLRNAISLNSSTFQLGSLIGPAVGGILLTAIGGGWSFAINAAACLVVVAALCSMNASELIRVPPRPRLKGQLREGIRYAGGKPAILMTLIVLGSVSMFAYNMPVLLAAYANNVFHIGAAGYGVLNAFVAAGALIGALASTRRIGVGLRTTIGGAAALGIVQAAAAFIPALAPFALVIVVVGASSLLFLTAANSLVQFSSNLGVRGRVMALYILLQLGGQAIGAPLMGWIVESFGVHVGMAVSGLVPLTVATVVGIVIARRRGLALKVHVGGVPRIAIVSRRSRVDA